MSSTTIPSKKTYLGEINIENGNEIVNDRPLSQYIQRVEEAMASRGIKGLTLTPCDDNPYTCVTVNVSPKTFIKTALSSLEDTLLIQSQGAGNGSFRFDNSNYESLSDRLFKREENNEDVSQVPIGELLEADRMAYEGMQRAVIIDRMEGFLSTYTRFSEANISEEDYLQAGIELENREKACGNKNPADFVREVLTPAVGEDVAKQTLERWASAARLVEAYDANPLMRGEKLEIPILLEEEQGDSGNTEYLFTLPVKYSKLESDIGKALSNVLLHTNVRAKKNFEEDEDGLAVMRVSEGKLAPHYLSNVQSRLSNHPEFNDCTLTVIDENFNYESISSEGYTGGNGKSTPTTNGPTTDVQNHIKGFIDDLREKYGSNRALGDKLGVKNDNKVSYYYVRGILPTRDPSLMLKFIEVSSYSTPEEFFATFPRDTESQAYAQEVMNVIRKFQDSQ